MAHALMKDGLGEAAVERIIAGLLGAGATFSSDQFRHDAVLPLSDLELKERVAHLILVMHRHLPSSFPEAAAILGRVREHWDEGEEADPHRSFAAWPIIDYAAEHGLNHPTISLNLLRELTSMFTAEFAIRPFISAHPEETYEQLTLWCMDSNEHVRRLASEGIRPRLPWGKQLTEYIRDPAPIIHLLENLKDDPSDYVRRSVANNLNDISKDHPDLVIETCRRWKQEKVAAREWIIRHATRTLIKDGHPEVFPLLGFTSNPKLQIDTFRVSPQEIALGDELTIEAKITSHGKITQRVVIDYALHLMKANGRTAPKVFKWKNLTLKPEASVLLEKKQAIKSITTRRYYAGEQKIAIMVNGKEIKESSFTLIDESAGI